MATIWDNPEITIGDLYRPAMEITNQLEADEYLAHLINRQMVCYGETAEIGYANELRNLGYFAGYYDREVAVRVQMLFGAAHPIIPSGASPDEILALGMEWASK